MSIDLLAFEPQFLDHGAPVWLALPAGLRGRLLTDAPLAERARDLGIEPTIVDAQALRETPQVGPVHDGMPALVTSIGDIKVGRRLGYGPFAFLEHGAGQSYAGYNATMASYPGGPDRDDCALFLVPNEYSASRWRTSYPQARVEVVGSPRLDSLPAKVGTEPCVAISFHGDWPNGVPYGGNALPDFAPRLAELAKRFSMIGHGHPGKGWGQRLRRLYERAGIEFVAEFDEVCRRADVYVCDNSSTIFEFAATGRPVVLLNAATWHPKHGPGLRFWEASVIGPNVWPQDDLGETIERTWQERDSAILQRFREETLLRYVYQPSLTGAAERAAAAVSGWLAGREEVAA